MMTTHFSAYASLALTLALVAGCRGAAPSAPRAPLAPPATEETRVTVADVTLQPTRKLQFYGGGATLGVLDPNTLLIRTFPQLGAVDVRSAAADGSGRVAYIDNRDGRAHLLDTTTGQDFIVPVADRGLRHLNDVALSGDGSTLVYTGVAGGVPSVYATTLGTGRQLAFGFLGHTGVQNVQPSVDGRHLLFLDHGRLRELDLRSGFIDNLALLAAPGAIQDAGYVDAHNQQIGFLRDGQFQVYDRRTHLIDTLPIPNRAADAALYGGPPLPIFGRVF